MLKFFVSLLSFVIWGTVIFYFFFFFEILFLSTTAELSQTERPQAIINKRVNGPGAASIPDSHSATHGEFLTSALPSSAFRVRGLVHAYVGIYKNAKKPHKPQATCAQTRKCDITSECKDNQKPEEKQKQHIN